MHVVAKPRTVFFSLDDTLVVRHGVFDECLQPALMMAAVAYPDLEIDRLRRDFHAASEVMTPQGGLLDRSDCFAAVLKRQNVIDAPLVHNMTMIYSDLRRRRLEAMPGALVTLQALAPLYQLGVITNSRAARAFEKISMLGLEQYLSPVVVAEHAGIAKPDAGIFEFALEQAGVEASQAIMVGDSQDVDIVGARAVGMLVVWFNSRGETLGPGMPEPDYEIKDLRQLITLLSAEQAA